MNFKQRAVARVDGGLGRVGFIQGIDGCKYIPREDILER